jgi:hypothetical protein
VGPRVRRAPSPSRLARQRRGRAPSPRRVARPPAQQSRPSLVRLRRRLRNRRTLPTRSRLRMRFRYGIRRRHRNRSNRFERGSDLARRRNSLTVSQSLRPHNNPRPQPHQRQRQPRRLRPLHRTPRAMHQHHRLVRRQSSSLELSPRRPPAKEPELRLLRLRVLRPLASPPRPKPVPRRQPHSRACPSRRAVRTSPPVRRPYRGPSLRHPGPWLRHPVLSRPDRKPGRRRPDILERPAHSLSRHQFKRLRIQRQARRRPLRQLQISPHRKPITQQSRRWGWHGVPERRGCDSRGSTRGR